MQITGIYLEVRLESPLPVPWQLKMHSPLQVQSYPVLCSPVDRAKGSAAKANAAVPNSAPM